MSRYKEHRGPKRRGYDDDYTPDYSAAERQPDYFSPRPPLTQGLNRPGFAGGHFV
jgi:hypothetical protein